jgi:hypothetical protein
MTKVPSYVVDWRWWMILAVMLATSHVQAVARQVEKLSGLSQQHNFSTYRYLFGGKPWISWLMFRWGA